MHPNLGDDLQRAILQTVAYADVFDYPLTDREIHRYLIGNPSPLEGVRWFLEDTSLLSQVGGFHTFPGREALVRIRRRREGVSSRLWRHALRYGRLIAGLPFVRMVAVTGALAVNNVEPGADIDYLVVTEPGKVWSCRAMILLLARMARLQGITLCPNYLLSLHSLAFPDQNLYAAHEFAQMVPLAGLDVYERMHESNPWVASFLPNAVSAPEVPAVSVYPRTRSLERPALERLLRTSPFAMLERWEMDRKIRMLRSEQGGSPESHFSADCCKGHAHRHQEHIYGALNDRLDYWSQEVLS